MTLCALQMGKVVTVGRLSAPGHKFQILCAVSFRQKTAAKVFRFHYHHAAAILLDIPICFRVTYLWVGDEFDLSGLTVKDNSVTFPYFLSRLINERQGDITPALRRR
jgi:hypothetical protein